MKTFRKLVCLGLALLMMQSLSIVTYAQTPTDETELINTTEQLTSSDDNTFNLDMKQRIIVTEEYAKSNKNPLLRYGESEIPNVLKTEYKTTTVTPTGQNPSGTQFRNGGGFFVQTSGGYTMTVSFGLSWEVVNVGVSVGYAKTDNIGGILVNVPNQTDFFKVQLDKTYKFDRVLVDCYKYNQYQYSYYTTWKKLDSTSAYCVKV